MDEPQSSGTKHEASSSSKEHDDEIHQFKHKKKPKFTHDPHDSLVVDESNKSDYQFADTQLGSPLTCGRHRQSGRFTEAVFKRTSGDWRRDYLISNYPQIPEHYYSIIVNNYIYFSYLFQHCCDDTVRCDAIANVVINEIHKRQ